MENIKMWILSLSGATAITALFKILFSNSKTEKVTNIFFSIFILFYTIIPMKNIFYNANLNQSFSENEYKYDATESYSRIIESSIINLCNQLDVKIENVIIDAYTNTDGYLYVENIQVDIENNDMIDNVKVMIKEKLGFEVTVS